MSDERNWTGMRTNDEEPPAEYGPGMNVDPHSERNLTIKCEPESSDGEDLFE